MKERLTAELPEKVETLLFLIIICTLQKSASPRKLFFSFLFMTVLGYLGQMEVAPKFMNHTFSTLEMFLDFLLNLISSTFQESQFESHLFD